MTRPDGRLLLMVKPQFEVGRAALGRGGVVRDPDLQARAVDRVCEAAADLGWYAASVVPSRLPGPAGNLEFFVLLARRAPISPVDVAASVGSS